MNTTAGDLLVAMTSPPTSGHDETIDAASGVPLTSTGPMLDTEPSELAPNTVPAIRPRTNMIFIDTFTPISDVRTDTSTPCNSKRVEVLIQEGDPILLD